MAGVGHQPSFAISGGVERGPSMALNDSAKPGDFVVSRHLDRRQVLQFALTRSVAAVRSATGRSPVRATR